MGSGNRIAGRDGSSLIVIVILILILILKKFEDEEEKEDEEDFIAFARTSIPKASPSTEGISQSRAG